ncbi:MAG: flagellar biosynthetic protein FliP, partial [Spirochaetaceae bacterium]|nr:flagellar biosynthetic protein FliP [Spirochaetaceae bacterium]
MRGFSLCVFLCLTIFPVGIAAQTLPAPAVPFPGLSTEGTMEIPQPAQGPAIPFIDLAIRSPETGREVAFSVQLLLLLTVITLAPSFIILMTSFLRISIV